MEKPERPDQPDARKAARTLDRWPWPPRPITVDWLLAQRRNIDRLPEMDQKILERDLWRVVLEAIADGGCSDPGACARAVMRSTRED